MPRAAGQRGRPHIHSEPLAADVHAHINVFPPHASAPAEDRKRIQHLLAITQPAGPETTHFVQGRALESAGDDRDIAKVRFECDEFACVMKTTEISDARRDETRPPPRAI